MRSSLDSLVFDRMASVSVFKIILFGSYDSVI
nr:MAG TPA: hypothetical protein [Caudoviricetes sp.]